MGQCICLLSLGMTYQIRVLQFFCDNKKFQLARSYDTFFDFIDISFVNIARDAEDVTIKIDENSNTRLRITRSSIGRVIQDADSDSNS